LAEVFLTADFFLEAGVAASEQATTTSTVAINRRRFIKPKNGAGS
jgi:hypothetical protein